MSKEFNEKLSKLQQDLKAPKGQTNKFGGYSYRSCEDILESVKPLLGSMSLIIKDEVIVIGSDDKQRFYVKATAILSDGENKIKASAFAREAEVQKGMSDSQITGSASSYARKYALNGLLLIDDTKDADATNDHGKAPSKSPVKKAGKKDEPKAETKKTGNSFRKSTKPKAKEVEEEEEL